MLYLAIYGVLPEVAAAFTAIYLTGWCRALYTRTPFGIAAPPKKERGGGIAQACLCAHFFGPNTAQNKALQGDIKKKSKKCKINLTKNN